jgi:two-component system response regulator YesN
MDIVGVASGASAVAAARERRFDAIILDVRMPRVSGLEIFEELRALQLGVPIIFVSAMNTADTAMSAIRLGAFDYVTKPFDGESLSSIVRHALAAAPGVVSVVGSDLGWSAAIAVLAAARAGVLVVLGAWPGAVRTVNADGSIAAVYAAIAPGAAPLSDFVARVATYVRANYVRVNVDALAEAIGLSPGHLSRIFREETSLTAKDYVTRVRIEVARVLLRETHETLEVIADRVGLFDASHLTRVFRRHTAETPGGFRRATGLTISAVGR